MRLDKYLSLAQVGTRKKVKEYIYAGDVSVNGELATAPAREIDSEKDCITYLGNVLEQINTICYMFNKPQGCITAKSDENYPTVFDYFQDVDTTGLFAVGRLDRNTEGLLLITNDGALNHRLMDPEHHVEKTYYFWVFGNVTEEGIRFIEQGMDIGDGEMTEPASIEIVTRGTYSEQKAQMEAEGCYQVKRNLHKEDVTAGYLTISQGKKHQVKRMMRGIGCYVVFLKRVSIGGFPLDEQLQPGEYKVIEPEVIRRLGTID